MTFPKVVPSHNGTISEAYINIKITPFLTSTFQNLVITVDPELEYFLCEYLSQLVYGKIIPLSY